LEKGSRAIFSTPAQRCSVSRPNPMRESARYHFPMPWSPLAGTHLSRPSSPKSSPAPRPRVVADEYPIAEPPTHRFLLTTVPPPMCPHLGPVPSPLVQHGILSTLSLAPCLASRCAARMLVPTARRRGPRAARFAGRAASAKSAPSRLGHSLPFTRLHSVRWQAYVCRVATLCPPPCPAHPCQWRTNKCIHIASMPSHCHCTVAATPCCAREHTHRSAALSHHLPLSPSRRPALPSRNA
jgi:hypothetical protein